MKADTINAVLNLVTGLLVFGTAMIPVIRSMLTKLNATADKERVRRIAFTLGSLLMLCAASAFYAFDQQWIAVALFGIHAVLTVVKFLSGSGYASRGEVFWDAVHPVALFLFAFLFAWITDTTSMVPNR